MVENIPDWAADRAVILMNAGVAGIGRDTSTWNISDRSDPETGLPQFARYIAEHEEAPVDPLLIEAREIASRHYDGAGWAGSKEVAAKIVAGERDDMTEVQMALAALRRGLELAREPQS